MTRNLAAIIACRNNGSRLYGKPFQNLSISKNWSILDQIIFNIKNLGMVDEIVLAILASGSSNKSFVEYARKNKP